MTSDTTNLRQFYEKKEPMIKANDKNKSFRRVIPILSISAALLFLGFVTPAHATEPDEMSFILNSFSFLIWGVLVMWMCAGFTMLESGCVRTKNVSVICLKNIGLFSIASLAYYTVGYNVMYVDVEAGGFFGSFKLFYGSNEAELALIEGLTEDTAAVVEGGYSTMSDWFFQMVFVATTASIISGTLAERVRLAPFFVFVAGLTAFIYPTVGAWHWGGGWLAEMGFQDFAGSTIVHSTGGWAALAGAILLGARGGRFQADGTVRSMPPSNVPIVTLGVFILWMGWFGFNGGSQLALSSALDLVAISNILANTNIAAAAGVIMSLIVSRPLLGRIDLMATLNGAIAGLVAITAGPDIVNHQWAIFIGAIGGLISVLGIKLLEVSKIDDVVGAIPAHLFAGVWGTLAVCIAAGGDIIVQAIGIAAIGVFVFGTSIILWFVIDKLIGLRVSPQAEALGQDVTELGIEAYPEFVAVPEDIDI